MILVNLTVGRNPWRKATMNDPTFATYAKKPIASFFKSIFPTISDELASLLPHVFCLDPARRISLPELRVRISCMWSFVCNEKMPSLRRRTSSRQQPQPVVATIEKAITAAKVECSPSLVDAWCCYSDGFADDDDDIDGYFTCFTSPCSSNYTSLSTEHHHSPVLAVHPAVDIKKITKQQQQHLHAETSLLAFSPYTSSFRV